MKKNLILFLTLFLGLKTLAATEPVVSLSDMKLKPGQQTTVSLELQNVDFAITSLQGDFILPTGVTVSDVTLVSDRIKTNNAVASHVLNANAQRFVVTANKEYGSVAAVDGTSGAILSFKVNVAESVAYGKYEIGIANVELGDAQFNAHYAGCTATLTVYEEYTVAATAADDKMGTVTGAGTYEYGDEVTLTATANEGYHFVNWTSDGTVVSVSDTYKFAVTANTTLTAVFAPNVYTLTFVLNNGEANVVKKQDFGTELTAPTGFLKTGYSFSGWTPEVPATVPAENMTYTAQWTINQYTMTFVLNNGEENIVITQDYGTELVAPAPLKDGHTFAGWDVAIPATIPAENMTFNATWTVNQYTMTFVLNNGKPDVVKTLDFGTELTAPEDVTKPAYVLAGWDPELPATVPSVNMTFKAIWTPEEYAITYDYAGGALAEGDTNPTTYTIESDAITLKNPVRDGYTFAGWTGTGLTEATMEVTIAKGSTGARSYAATWTPITYTLTYDLASGALPEGKTNPATYTIESEDITLVNPERVGYTFAGWTGTGLEAATVEVKIAKGSTGDRSYTATWTPTVYTLTYDLAGGVLAEGEVNPATYTIESETITLKNPVREGYEFAGWIGTGLETATVNVTIAKGSTGDRSYTATWTPITYTISYDLAGGALAQGDTNPATYTIESDAITLKNPTREGYDFTGWTGTGLTEATMVVTIAKGSIGNRTYTATWEETVGVKAIFRDSKALNVYTVSGSLVGRDMTVDEVLQLKSGIYVINGRKVAIK